ncbi:MULTISPECIES: DUF1441 family protein [Pseudomonas]|uniref:DUF1441 family protein n=1 Tax=Pseudomonas TaxID=286 RepID=UPI0015E88DCA|nr:MULTISPECIES: DUF1441 family protein [Pseudomonas]
MAGRPDSKVMDEGTKEILFEGASISQLGRLFGMDNRTVTSKLATNVQPVGRRAGHSIYAVKDAAPYLVEQNLDLSDLEKIAAYVQRLDPSRLPRQLTKDFWQAMLNKQKFEEQAGDLWRTAKVVEVYADLVKAIRTPLILAGDTVNNQTELSPRQRQILNEVIDDLLEMLHEAVVKQFGEDEQPPEADDDDL